VELTPAVTVDVTDLVALSQALLRGSELRPDARRS
jgi:hypothetical protein